MRIGIDARCLLETRYSGISEYVYNLIDHLSLVDNTQTYQLFYNAAHIQSLPSFKNPSQLQNHQFHYSNKLLNLSMQFLGIPKLDHLIGGADVMVLPNFLFARVSRTCRIVLIVYDLTFAIYPEFFTFKKRLLMKLINPKAWCQRADLIIAISEHTKQDLMAIYGIPADKIIVVYPGIGERFFAPITSEDRQRVKKQYQLPERYFLYVGNIEPRKNISSLLTAWEQADIPDTTELIIAGQSAWKYRSMMSRWRRSKARQRIRFIGYVPAEDQPALYADAIATVYPSFYEGFGLPPAESLACGTPVIASHASAIPEVVGRAGILIDPYNVNALQRAIEIMSNDLGVRQQLADLAKPQAEQFRWSTAAQQIVQSIQTRL